VGPLRRNDLAKAGAFIAAGSFAVRLAFPVLSGDVFLALNLWEYPQMMALFALGVLARERGWLTEALPRDLRRTCGRAAGLGVVLAALLGAGIAMSDDPEPYLGGLRFEATLIPLTEATLALGMSLWLIDWFRRRTNNIDPRVSRLGRASFAAYLLHVPVTVLLAIAIRDVPFPGELKFVLVFALGAAASFTIGRLLRTPSIGARTP
jgi:peptidoglycan/LPS O-acetylase OafA/YrhL